MHTAVNITSIEAYRLKAAKLSESRRAVYAVIVQYGPISNKGILDFLQRTEPWEHWEINKITGRNKELRDMGFVEHAGYAMDDKSGCKVHLWRPMPERVEPQIKLF